MTKCNENCLYATGNSKRTQIHSIQKGQRICQILCPFLHPYGLIYREHRKKTMSIPRLPRKMRAEIHAWVPHNTLLPEIQSRADLPSCNK